MSKKKGEGENVYECGSCDYGVDDDDYDDDDVYDGE